MVASPGYVSMDGSSGVGVLTPDHASFDFTNDADVRVLAKFDALGAGDDLLVGRWVGAGPAENCFTFLRVGGGSALGIRWTTSGGTFNSQDSNTALATTGVRWYRFTLDIDNGSSQRVVTFYYSDDDPLTAPASVSWTQHSQHTGAVTNIRTGTIGIDLGNREDDPAGEQMNGRIYWATALNGIGGTAFMDPDFRDADQITTPNTVFTDTTGKVWTLQGAAVWVPNTSGEFTGLIIGSPPYVIP